MPSVRVLTLTVPLMFSFAITTTAISPLPWKCFGEVTIWKSDALDVKKKIWHESFSGLVQNRPIMYKYGRISPKLSDRRQFLLIIYSIHNVFWDEIPKKKIKGMYRSIKFKVKERPCCIPHAAAVPDIQEWSSVTYKISVRDSLSSLNYPPSPQAAVIHLNSAQRHGEVKIFKRPPCWSVCDLCVLLFSVQFNRR